MYDFLDGSNPKLSQKVIILETGVAVIHTIISPKKDALIFHKLERTC